MTPTIDTTLLTYHANIERKERIDFIENTIGFGRKCYSCEDPADPGVIKSLTTTGVIVVESKVTGLIITMYVARVAQALNVIKLATGKLNINPRLWDYINYNNNTSYWKQRVAA